MKHEQLVSTLILMGWTPFSGGFFFPPGVIPGFAPPYLMITSENEVVLTLKDNAVKETLTNQQTIDKILEAEEDI